MQVLYTCDPECLENLGSAWKQRKQVEARFDHAPTIHHLMKASIRDFVTAGGLQQRGKREKNTLGKLPFTVVKYRN